MGMKFCKIRPGTAKLVALEHLENPHRFQIFKISLYTYHRHSINGLVTDGNTKLCCRGLLLALF